MNKQVPIETEAAAAGMFAIYGAQVLREWRTVLACGVLFAVFAWLLNFALPVRYTASMIVAPKQSSMLNDTGGNLMRSMGGLSALAKLQGQSGDTTYDQYATLLYSQDLANALLKDRQSIGTIFQLNWDPASKQWQKPFGPVFLLKEGVKAILGLRPWHPPEAADVEEYLNRHIALQLDRRTGFSTISYSYKDPYFARKFLMEVHSIADGLLRQHLLAMTNQRIAYLDNELKVTSMADARLTLTDLLVNEAKTQMIARADTTFAVDVIDAPIVPERPSSPARVQNILIGLLLGLALSASAFAVGGARTRVLADGILRRLMLRAHRRKPSHTG